MDPIDTFNVFLPSNASMDLFTDNTPDSFRTKLAQPVSLRGLYEVALSEISMPGRFFTIQKNYNDSYTVDKNVLLPAPVLLPTLHVKVHDTKDFAQAFNDQQALASLKYEQNKLTFSLPPHTRLNIMPSDGKELLAALGQAAIEIIAGDKGIVESFDTYRPPSKKFRNQVVKLTLLKPIVLRSTVYVFFKADLFEGLNNDIQRDFGDSYVVFKLDSATNKVTIDLQYGVHLVLEQAACPKLLKALNTGPCIIKSTAVFDYTAPTDDLTETFTIIIHRVFTVDRKTKTTFKLKINPGMYRSSESFFREIRDVGLRELPDAKVELTVPSETVITFDEKLKDLLGFVNTTFFEGTYISDYIIELSAGITEVYVYTDIIEPSLLGHAFAPILKIVPIANEKSDQIVKYFSVPLYFKVKKQHFDTIKIELRTSRGTPIQFISGKSSLVLNFRKRNL